MLFHGADVLSTRAARARTRQPAPMPRIRPEAGCPSSDCFFFWISHINICYVRYRLLPKLVVAVAVSEDATRVCVARSIGATGRMLTQSDAYGARGGLIAARRCQDAKRVLTDFEAAGDIRKVQAEPLTTHCTIFDSLPCRCSSIIGVC